LLSLIFCTIVAGTITEPQVHICHKQRSAFGYGCEATLISVPYDALSSHFDSFDDGQCTSCIDSVDKGVWLSGQELSKLCRERCPKATQEVDQQSECETRGFTCVTPGTCNGTALILLCPNDGTSCCQPPCNLSCDCTSHNLTCVPTGTCNGTATNYSCGAAGMTCCQPPSACESQGLNCVSGPNQCNGTVESFIDCGSSPSGPTCCNSSSSSNSSSSNSTLSTNCSSHGFTCVPVIPGSCNGTSPPFSCSINGSVGTMCCQFAPPQSECESHGFHCVATAPNACNGTIKNYVCLPGGAVGQECCQYSSNLPVESRCECERQGGTCVVAGACKGTSTNHACDHSGGVGTICCKQSRRNNHHRYW